MIKYLIIGLVIAGLVGALGVAGKIILNQNTTIATLEVAVKDANAVIEKTTLQNARLQYEYNKLQKDYATAEANYNELQALFYDHDFPELVRKKPKPLEKLINKATDETLQRFREFGQ